jgi:DNA/RNA endonuclease G (NUC1)
MPFAQRAYRAAIIVSFVIFLALPAATFPQICSGCEVSQQTVTKANNRLNLDEQQKADAESRHLLGGRPTPPASATNEHMIHQLEWVTWYDDDLRLPLWVAYELTKADASAQLSRKDCFRKDPRLPDAAASTCEDYQEPIFDRGHMIPNADLNRARLAQTNSFIFTNMVPQHDTFNSGIWSRLESKVRAWAKVANGVYVVSGAIFDKDDDGQRDADEDADLVTSTNRVAIPTHFYKIILHVRPSGFIDTISFILPHLDLSVGSTNPYLFDHIRTIDDIESITGIDFFPELSDQRETTVESFRASGLWQTD